MLQNHMCYTTSAVLTNAIVRTFPRVLRALAEPLWHNCTTAPPEASSGIIGAILDLSIPCGYLRWPARHPILLDSNVSHASLGVVQKQRALLQVCYNLVSLFTNNRDGRGLVSCSAIRNILNGMSVVYKMTLVLIYRVE